MKSEMEEHLCRHLRGKNYVNINNGAVGMLPSHRALKSQNSIKENLNENDVT